MPSQFPNFAGLNTRPRAGCFRRSGGGYAPADRRCILEAAPNTTRTPTACATPSTVERQGTFTLTTDAEIVADQKKHQAAKEAAAKERQRQFQKLEKQLGM